MVDLRITEIDSQVGQAGQDPGSLVRSELMSTMQSQAVGAMQILHNEYQGHIQNAQQEYRRTVLGFQ